MKACIAIKVMLTTHHGFLEEARLVFFPIHLWSRTPGVGAGDF